MDELVKISYKSLCSSASIRFSVLSELRGKSLRKH